MEQKYFKMTTKADFVIQRKSPATAGGEAAFAQILTLDG